MKMSFPVSNPLYQLIRAFRWLLLGCLFSSAGVQAGQRGPVIVQGWTQELYSNGLVGKSIDDKLRLIDLDSDSYGFIYLMVEQVTKGDESDELVFFDLIRLRPDGRMSWSRRFEHGVPSHLECGSGEDVYVLSQLMKQEASSGKEKGYTVTKYSNGGGEAWTRDLESESGASDDIDDLQMSVNSSGNLLLTGVPSSAYRLEPFELSGGLPFFVTLDGVGNGISHYELSARPNRPVHLAQQSSVQIGFVGMASGELKLIEKGTDSASDFSNTDAESQESNARSSATDVEKLFGGMFGKDGKLIWNRWLDAHPMPYEGCKVREMICSVDDRSRLSVLLQFARKTPDSNQTPNKGSPANHAGDHRSAKCLMRIVDEGGAWLKDLKFESADLNPMVYVESLQNQSGNDEALEYLILHGKGDASVDESNEMQRKRDKSAVYYLSDDGTSRLERALTWNDQHIPSMGSLHKGILYLGGNTASTDPTPDHSVFSEPFVGQFLIASNDVWIDDGFLPGASKSVVKPDKWVWSDQPTYQEKKFKVHASPYMNRGLSQHYFQGATQAIQPKAEDKIYAYVYLDPKNPPKQIMLQFYENGSWEHRAYWGETDWTGLGVPDSPSQRHIADLPQTGRWHRLVVDPASLALTDRSIVGAAFTHFDGKVYWGEMGLLKTREGDTDEEVPWVRDAIPPGGSEHVNGEDGWKWSHVKQGEHTLMVHESPLVEDRFNQYSFVMKESTWKVNSGDVLFAYCLLEEDSLPKEIMIQWFDGQSWSHRAFWGDDLIQSATLNTDNRIYQGRISPENGRMLLKVDANEVGLGGKTIRGMAFSQFGGRTRWEKVGKQPGTISGREIVWFDEQLPESAVPVSSERHSWTWWSGSDTLPASSGNQYFQSSFSGELLNRFEVTGYPMDMQVFSDETLFADAYLNPNAPPKAVALSWWNGYAWSPPVYWSAENYQGAATFGEGSVRMGPLPPAGSWERLQVPMQAFDLKRLQGALQPFGWDYSYFSGIAFILDGGQVNFDRIGKTTVPVAASFSDKTIWLDDRLITGDNPMFTPKEASWEWVEDQVSSGKKALRSPISDSVDEHKIEFGFPSVRLQEGDLGEHLLIADVYLPTSHVPRKIMIEWRESSGDKEVTTVSRRQWNHRAFWGDHTIDGPGEDDTQGHFYMGVLPKPGKWVRLEVPASLVGLSGVEIDRVALSVYNGQAYWDAVGKTSLSGDSDTMTDRSLIELGAPGQDIFPIPDVTSLYKLVDSRFFQLTPAETKFMDHLLGNKKGVTFSPYQDGVELANRSGFAQQSLQLRGGFLSWFFANEKVIEAIDVARPFLIKGATITGNLELPPTEVRFPLLFSECEFIQPIQLNGAKLQQLSLERCRMKGLEAAGAVITGNLTIEGEGPVVPAEGSDARLDGRINLIGASIGGNLEFKNIRFGQTAHDHSIEASGLKVSGDVIIDGVEGGKGAAFDDAQLGGSLQLNHFKVASHEQESADDEKDVIGLRLAGAKIGMNLHMKQSSLLTQKKTINLDTGSQSDQDGGDAKTTAKQNISIDAQSIEVGRELRISGTEMDGLINLNYASVGQKFLIQHSTIRVSDKETSASILARNAQFKGDVDFSDGFRPFGRIDLSRSRIEQEFIWRGEALQEAGLNLEGAYANTLNDDRLSCTNTNKNLNLNHFVYDRLAPDDTPREASLRLAWLERQNVDHYHPQPYEQLASVFKFYGQESDARAVMMAKQEKRVQSGKMKFFLRTWFWILGLIIGYGYQTWKVVLIMMAFITAGSVVAYRGRETMAKRKSDFVLGEGEQERTFEVKFNAFVYSIDKFIPLIELGHSKEYVSSDVRIRFYMYIHVAAGWILSTFFAIAISGLVK